MRKTVSEGPALPDFLPSSFNIHHSVRDSIPRGLGIFAFIAFCGEASLSSRNCLADAVAFSVLGLMAEFLQGRAGQLH